MKIKWKTWNLMWKYTQPKQQPEEIEIAYESPTNRANVSTKFTDDKFRLDFAIVSDKDTFWLHCKLPPSPLTAHNSPTSQYSRHSLSTGIITVTDCAAGVAWVRIWGSGGVPHNATTWKFNASAWVSVCYVRYIKESYCCFCYSYRHINNTSWYSTMVYVVYVWHCPHHSTAFHWPLSTPFAVD